MCKIKCLNPIAKEGLGLLKKGYELTDDVNQANAILVRSASMHEMELPDSLECVARAGAGVNNIPLDKCAEKGIVVFNTPGANANGVKELVLAALLMTSRDVIGGIEWVKANADDPDVAKKMEKAKKQFAGKEIKGKTIGVVGLGAIGILVANTCERLGMRVIGYDPYISVYSALHLSTHVEVAESLEELVPKVDYLTIHVPATAETKGMLNKDIFDRMKDGSILLNFARDVLVNEYDLQVAIESGRIAKYATDFPNTNVASMKNVIAFPHLGASTEESETNCAIMACRQLMDYMDNGNIVNSVNFPKCDMGPIKGRARICVFNQNVPNMIGQFATVLASMNINIPAMTNESKGNLAYTIMDSDSDVDDSIIDRLMEIPEVFKVRVIRKQA